MLCFCFVYVVAITSFQHLILRWNSIVYSWKNFNIPEKHWHIILVFIVGDMDDRTNRHVAQHRDNKCSLLTIYSPTLVFLSTLSSIYIYLPRWSCTDQPVKMKFPTRVFQKWDLYFESRLRLMVSKAKQIW